MCEGIGAGGQAGMLGVVVLSSGSWSKGAQQWRECGGGGLPGIQLQTPPPWFPIHRCPQALQGRRVHGTQQISAPKASRSSFKQQFPSGACAILWVPFPMAHTMACVCDGEVRSQL